MSKSAILAVASVSAAVPAEVRRKFNEFELAFGTSTSTSSVARTNRLERFAKNLDTIKEMQQHERGSAVYSHLTPFADLSAEEFSSRLGLLPSDLDMEMAGPLSADRLPDAFDWRENGFTNHVKNQLQCGSCWTFSVIGNLEGAGFKSTGKLVRLSEQQLLDCASKGTGSGPSQGCSGGFTDKTMQWMVDNGMGIEYEEDYPYKAKASTCSHQTSLDVLKIAAFVQIPKDEDQIAAAMVQYGALSACVNANDWHLYESGIYDQESCIDAGLNHGVVLVAFGVDNAIPYWTIRNSWGWGFGEKGHIRLVRGKGMCGVQKRVVTAQSITIDDSRPEPPFVLGPNCCETKQIATEDECKSYCSNHSGWHSWQTPGPYCGCQDGEGCKPYPECNENLTSLLV